MEEQHDILKIVDEQISLQQWSYRQFSPQWESGPILCVKCAMPWMECTCEDAGLVNRIAAFRGIGGRAITISTVEGTVFIEEEGGRDPSPLTAMISDEDFTHIAREWLRYVAKNAAPANHDHRFCNALDPAYQRCECGAVRRRTP